MITYLVEYMGAIEGELTLLCSSRLHLVYPLPLTTAEVTFLHQSPSTGIWIPPLRMILFFSTVTVTLSGLSSSPGSSVFHVKMRKKKTLFLHFLLRYNSYNINVTILKWFSSLEYIYYISQTSPDIPENFYY